MTDWHDSKTCDENMISIHGKIDGFVLLNVDVFFTYLRSQNFAISLL